MTDLPRLHFTSLGDTEIVGDVVESFRRAAQRLGYATSYADCRIETDAINVLFFCMTVSKDQIAMLGPNCIVVNFEQLHPGSAWLTEPYLKLLKESYVWEYSLTNFTRFREMGIPNVDHVPLGYEPESSPSRPAAATKQDIDVLFYGTISERRLRVLQQLEARGLRVKYTPGNRWPAAERDGYIRRAKVVLNMHVYDHSRIVEVPRLAQLFKLRKAVVCELYPDSEIDAHLRDAVAGAPLEGLVDACVALVRDAPRRKQLEQNGLTLFAQRTQSDILKPALDRYFRWRTQRLTPAAPAVIGASRARKISVIVPAYQAARHLQETLDSILRQTHRHTEILLINDGSTDQTSFIAKALGLSNVRVIDLPTNGGVSAARNRALDLATGDFVAMWDADDLCSPERLARQCAVLEALPQIGVVGSWAATFGTGAQTFMYPEMDHEIRAGFLGPSALLNGSCLLRRDFVERHALRFDTSYTIAEDLHFQFQCAVAGAGFANVPEVLYRYRLHAGSSHQRDADDSIAQMARARRWLLPHAFPHLDDPALDQLAQLYTFNWTVTPGYAARMLDLVANALSQPPGLRLEAATLTRIMRIEVMRMLYFFVRGGIVDNAWIDRRFAAPGVAALLAPGRDWLYHWNNTPAG